MGTWGVGPFQSDDAGDMLVALAVKIARVVRFKNDGPARDRYQEARAAIQLILVAHGTDILGGDSLEPSLRALARMRSDTLWLASFREPKRIAAKIEHELLGVLNRMRACNRCRPLIKSAGLQELTKKVCETKAPTSAFRGGARRNRNVVLRRLRRRKNR